MASVWILIRRSGLSSRRAGSVGITANAQAEKRTEQISYSMATSVISGATSLSA
jgi:hypothetical protein